MNTAETAAAESYTAAWNAYYEAAEATHNKTYILSEVFPKLAVGAVIELTEEEHMTAAKQAAAYFADVAYWASVADMAAQKLLMLGKPAQRLATQADIDSRTEIG